MRDERTRRDLDIIRQSSLKAAVDLTTAILPTLDNQTEISDLTLQLAEKFANWVFGDQVQNNVDEVREALNDLDNDHPDPASLKCYQDYSFAENPHSQNCFHEIHILQDTLGMPRTDFFSICPTHASWDKAAVQLVKLLRKQVHEALAYGKNPGSNGDNGGNGSRDNNKSDGPSTAGQKPLTRKQYGFIMGLHKELGQEPDRAEIDQMTVGEASDYIESLKNMAGYAGGNGGNGRSKRERRDVAPPF